MDNEYPELPEEIRSMLERGETIEEIRFRVPGNIYA